MSTNKYLEKIAGSGWSKAIKFADDLVGHSARRARTEADILSRAAAKGVSPGAAQRKADMLSARSLKSRVQAGVGVGVAGTAGFLGVHKYHQHKDNAILAKIDSMYVDPNR